MYLPTMMMLAPLVSALSTLSGVIPPATATSPFLPRISLICLMLPHSVTSASASPRSFAAVSKSTFLCNRTMSGLYRSDCSFSTKLSTFIMSSMEYIPCFIASWIAFSMDSIVPSPEIATASAVSSAAILTSTLPTSRVLRSAIINASCLSSLILLITPTPNFLISGVPASSSILSRSGRLFIILSTSSKLSKSSATCKYGGFHSFTTLKPIIGCAPRSFSAKTFPIDGYPSIALLIANFVAP